MFDKVQCSSCQRVYVPSPHDDFYSKPTPGNPNAGLCERCLMQQHSQATHRDPTPVPNDMVCKKGQSEMTCGFLGVESSSAGVRMVCLKGSDFESSIRERLREGSMRAKGDNCSGPPEFTANR